jgi:hypothetical protein
VLLQNRNCRYRACEEDSGKQGKIRSTQVLLFHSVSKENRFFIYIASKLYNEKKCKKNNDSSIVNFMPSRNKIKNKIGKKFVDTELAKIDSEKNTDREEVALHLLFVKVPQIHVNLQLLLQNLILFLQEFILNVVFVVVTTTQL